MRQRRRKRRKVREERAVDGGEGVVRLEEEEGGVDEARQEGFKEWTGFVSEFWRRSVYLVCWSLVGGRRNEGR